MTDALLSLNLAENLAETSQPCVIVNANKRSRSTRRERQNNHVTAPTPAIHAGKSYYGTSIRLGGCLIIQKILMASALLLCGIIGKSCRHQRRVADRNYIANEGSGRSYPRAASQVFVVE